MRIIRTLAVAAMAMTALVGAAEAGAKKHGVHYSPVWRGQYHNGGQCWYEYHKVPRVYYERDRLHGHGRPGWRNVKRVYYTSHPQRVCDWHRY
jgi:hypothetical protein